MDLETNFYQEVAEAVQKHRKQAGLTQIALANYAGVGKTVIYDIEHAKESVQVNTLLKVLVVLNIKLVLQSPLIDR